MCDLNYKQVSFALVLLCSAAASSCAEFSTVQQDSPGQDAVKNEASGAVVAKPRRVLSVEDRRVLREQIGVAAREIAKSDNNRSTRKSDTKEQPPEKTRD